MRLTRLWVSKLKLYLHVPSEDSMMSYRYIDSICVCRAKKGRFLATVTSPLASFSLPYLVTTALFSTQTVIMESHTTSTSSNLTARYNGPPLSEMNERQKKIRDEILSSRKGTGLSGPFGPWLAIPEIAEPAQALGRACRYGTSLSFKESELVILMTGAKTKSHTEFDIHFGEALKAGLPIDVIESIPRDDQFTVDAVHSSLIPKLQDTRLEAIAKFTAELLDTYSVTDETYEATKLILDSKDSVLVEIVAIVGYYNLVSYTLNTFRIPSDSKPPSDNA